MMWNYQSMMNWGQTDGFWFFGLVFWVVSFIDLVLLGMWLWKQINKK